MGTGTVGWDQRGPILARCVLWGEAETSQRARGEAAARPGRARSGRCRAALALRVSPRGAIKAAAHAPLLPHAAGTGGCGSARAGTRRRQ